MLQRKNYLFLLLILSLSLVSSAELIKPENPVKITFQPAATAEAGKSIETKLEIEIKPGWHLFSEKPEIPGISSTQVRLESSDRFTLEKVIFPKPEVVHSEIFKKDLKLYQNKIAITLHMKVNPGPSGKIPLQGILRYQACSDQLCRPPINQKFSGEQTVL